MNLDGCDAKTPYESRFHFFIKINVVFVSHEPQVK